MLFGRVSRIRSGSMREIGSLFQPESRPARDELESLPAYSGDCE